MTKTAYIRDSYFPGVVEVELVTATPKHSHTECFGVSADGLRKFLEPHQVTAIEKDGEAMEFCHTPRCNELIPVTSPCPLCDDCLEEYRAGQRDYHGEQLTVQYAGVIA